MKKFVESKINETLAANSNLDARFRVSFESPRRHFHTMIKTNDKTVIENIIILIADNWEEMIETTNVYMFCDEGHFYLTFEHGMEMYSTLGEYYTRMNRTIMFLQKHGCRLDLIDETMREFFQQSLKSKLYFLVNTFAAEGFYPSSERIIKSLGYSSN